VERALAALLLSFAAAASASGDPVTFPGPGIELAGRLYRPDGPGPFPAFVLMHGCSGMWRADGREPTPAYVAWAEHWRKRGYLAVLVDSFGPRGQKEICTQRGRAITPHQDRPRDAYAALAWLAARPDVDPARIHLQGWSNGGVAVLNTVKEGAPGRPAAGPEFRSAVAFYPGCVQLASLADYRIRVPLLIQSGEADDWTPARHCEALVQKFAGRGPPMEIDVYPEAHHAFDGLGAIRVRPDVRNLASSTGWGATVGANPQARAQAFRRTTEWVAERNR
jgi:dienelactone hydrolase